MTEHRTRCTNKSTRRLRGLPSLPSFPSFPSLRGLLGRVGGVAGAVILSGCYSYLPVESPVVGSVARLRVPITSAVADPTLPPETATVEGTVLETGDTVVVEVTTRREIGAFREFVQENTYRIASDELVSIEERQFSSRRSIGLGAILALAAGGFALIALTGDTGGDNPNPPDDGSTSGIAIRIPIGR